MFACKLFLQRVQSHIYSILTSGKYILQFAQIYCIVFEQIQIDAAIDQDTWPCLRASSSSRELQSQNTIFTWGTAAPAQSRLSFVIILGRDPHIVCKVIVQQRGVRKPGSPELNRGQLFYAAAAAPKVRKVP